MARGEGDRPMTLRFAVVHEAPADFETATELADRVLCNAIDWLDEDLLIHQRTWLGESAAGHRLTWKAIPQLALDAQITVAGHFDDGPARRGGCQAGDPPPAEGVSRPERHRAD